MSTVIPQLMLRPQVSIRVQLYSLLWASITLISVDAWGQSDPASVNAAPTPSHILSASPSSALSRAAGAGGSAQRGVIPRATLERVAQGGLPHLLAQTRIKPARRKGRFIGFKLAQIAQGSVAKRAGFRVGDVIKRVNGESIGRPDQMLSLIHI